MIQGVLNFGLTSKPQVCKACGMSYHPHIKDDKAMHTKYHTNFVNGPKFETGSLEPLKEIRLLHSKKSHQCEVFKIPKNNKRLIEKTETVMKMVNAELNAPPENSTWKCTSNTPIQGQAFVAIIDKKLVGVCTTEAILDHAKQSRWMHHDTQEVVPKSVNKNAKVGISRIWVAPRWRRLGLGSILLNVVSSHSVYGMTLKKHEIAFSQPSYTGGLLAKSYSGVKAQNGKLYVPIYIEL